MRTQRFFLAFFLPLFLHQAPSVANFPGPAGISRFHRVDDGFFRGGQPSENGLRDLRGLGIRTVINLRMENDEQKLVESMGMAYIHIPIKLTTWRMFWERIPEPAVLSFLSAMEDPANYPVFIHCQRGADRTGALVGLYRIAFQGWTAEQAYSEARQKGLRWWFRGLKSQLRDFAQKSAGEPSPPSDAPFKR